MSGKFANSVQILSMWDGIRNVGEKAKNNKSVIKYGMGGRAATI